MQWIGIKTPIQANGLKSISGLFTIMPDGSSITVLKAGGNISASVNYNQIEHFIIGIYPRNFPFCPNDRGIEPTYQQKVTILKELGFWKEVALEVMPPEHEVVDREDVYHIWEYPTLYCFCADLTPIFKAPKDLEKSYDGVFYHVESKAGTRYIYYHSDKEVGWRTKQNLKNLVAGKESTAVEVICEVMANENYGCLVVLKPGLYLDFGLY